MRLRHILILALSLFCLSCSEDDRGHAVKEYPVEVTLGCDMTKVGLDGNDLFWQSGDQVAFRAKSAAGEVAVAVLTLNDVDSGQPEAKFKGSVTMTEAPVSCEFAYPATAFDVSGKTVFDYSVQDGTHRPYLYGMTDYSADGMDCVLEHVGGLIRLTVAEGVTSVTVSGNSSEKISKLEMNSDGVLISTEGASISFDVPVAGGSALVFMPGMTFDTGFSIVSNHSDGSKMFKSFSKNGTAYSSYDFSAGSVLEIDLSQYVGFKADCEFKYEHQYTTEKILTGTTVTMTDFSIVGSPEKIIDQWGVAVYDSNNRFIRWCYGDGAYAGGEKVMSDYDGSWPLLLPGEYTVYVVCTINGQTLQFEATDKLQVTAPSFAVGVTGKTSWDYRNTPSTANTMDNDAIVEIGATLSVASSILANDHYDCQVSFSVSGNTSSTYNMNATPFTSDATFDGLAWGSHSLEASVTFCGVTQKTASPLTCYITGLPYQKTSWLASDLSTDTSQSTMWTYSGDVSCASSSLEFYANFWNNKDYHSILISPQFSLPSETLITTSIMGANKNSPGSWGSLDGDEFGYFYYKAGTKTTERDCSGAYVDTEYFAALDDLSQTKSDYKMSGTFSISSDKPCVVYSTTSHRYSKYLHAVKIEYAQ